MTTQKNIKGLLFDLGGVVINIDFDQALQIWARYSRLSIEVLRSHFSMDAEYQRHERGEINEAEYFKHLCNLLQLEANDSEIAMGWQRVFNHFGATITGNFSTRSRINSKEALPDPIIIPSRNVIRASYPSASSS